MTPPPVLIGLATVPEREAQLREVVAALAPQCDRLAVALNGYERVPAWLRRQPEHVHASVYDGSGGDAEKFAAVDDWEGYVLTCDDDIVYPQGYAQRLVAALHEWGNRRAVSYHGGVTHGYDGSAKAANHVSHRCLGSLARTDTSVNVVGTGTLAYDARRVPVWRAAFPTPNMADVHFAVHARELGIPLAVLEHRTRYLQPLGQAPGIYEANAAGDGTGMDTRAQREAELGRHNWRTHLPRPLIRVAVTTCARPQQCLALLSDLDRESRWCDLEVAVYEDPAGGDYSEAKRLCQKRGWRWRREPEHLGRLGHWRLIDRQLRDAKQSSAEWYISLPDDVTLVRHAIPKALRLWYRLAAPAVLALWRLQSREGQTCWTGKLPVAGPHGTEQFFVDGCYLTRRSTLAALGWRIHSLTPRTETSSGVGRQMSLRLHEAGLRMYRVNASLALDNSGGGSVMNPAERDRHPTVAL